MLKLKHFSSILFDGQAGIGHKLKKGHAVQYINIVTQIQRLFYTEMDSSRYYKNPFEDYPNPTSNLIINVNTKEINENYKATLHTSTKKLLDRLEEMKSRWAYHDDYSVYTGPAGIAYTFYQYGKCFNEPAYIDKATELLRMCVNKFRGKREITFLTGIAGPLALGSVVLHSQGSQDEASNMISKLKSLSSYVLKENSELPDELLYGRAGYLFSLLFLNSNISPPPIEDELIKQVIALIIKSGHVYSASRNYKTPLMYAWHDAEYIGGAHGLAGILYLLLQARKYLTLSQLEKDIKPALDFLQDLRYPSGNFPSSIGSHTDKLVHWCHGAPAMPMLFCLAYEIYQDDRYLKTALQCGEVVWSRGLLKKGYGICHGVAGNAYTFLSLFQQTKDVKHLYRACKFADWCMDFGTHQNRIPDRPFSLFEGVAGTIYFLIDMQNPLSAKFPTYTV
ncbi:glutathione S-transferase LANCL1 isoform X1 [Andrena cerasifolii]|uniref:glutathione S-transferase LANCL1 isoform X1 n=2 Tax=Andrena cerasifolii TaxID=2819439 RepID=UPI004037F52C